MNTLIPFLFKKILLFSKLLRIFYIPPFHTMVYHFKYIQNSTFLQSLLTQLLLPLFPDEAIYVYNLEKHNGMYTKKKTGIIYKCVFICFSYAQASRALSQM